MQVLDEFGIGMSGALREAPLQRVAAAALSLATPPASWTPPGAAVSQLEARLNSLRRSMMFIG
jgi:hypothetical protein